MAKKYEVIGAEALRTMRMSKASATVIAAGDLVAKDSNGYAINAAAASTAVAYCPNGAKAGELFAEVSVGNDFLLSGTGDDNFAITNKGTEVDITDTTQLIDLGSSSTDVLLVSPEFDAGTVGAKTGIKVRINKPIF